MDTNDTAEMLNQITGAIKAGTLTNLSTVLPFLFHLRGEPFSLKDHFLWEPLFKTEIPKKRTIKAARQTGKCTCKDTKVITESGSLVEAGSVRVGDKLSCIDDKSLRAVTGVVTNYWDTGVKRCLKITTGSGRSMVVTPEHKIRTLLGYSEAGALRVGSRVAVTREAGVFLSSPHQPEEDHIKLIAYMIGGGSTSGSQMSFTSADPDVIKEFTDICLRQDGRVPAVGYRDQPNPGVRTATIQIFSSSVLRDWIIEDNLEGGYSYSKECPDWVFNLSKENTILFLSRLWATDGSIKLTPTGFPAITYSSASRLLIDQVRSLLLKLGICCSLVTRMGQCLGKKTRLNYELRVSGVEGWELFLSQISVPGKPTIVIPEKNRNSNRDTIPMEISEVLHRLSRNTTVRKGSSLHKSGLRNTLEYPLSRSKLGKFISFFESQSGSEDHNFLINLRDGCIFWDVVTSIEDAGEVDTVDIEVAEHHNFVLADGLVVHNSESTGVQILTYTQLREFFNILYVSPRWEQTRTFSVDKVAPFIKSSPVFSNRDKNLPMNVTHRVAKEGNNIYFSYALADAERIRSKTAGAVFYDEAQDIDPVIIPVVNETMSASKDMGVTQNTGTPKTFDNYLEIEWSRSSQAEWCIPCYKCKKLNVSGVEFDLLKMVQPAGLSCAGCGTLLNTRFGWWEHRYPHRRALHEGYHAPQVVFPVHCERQPGEDKTKPGRKWVDLIMARDELPTFRFYNEKLAESYDNADELISKKALVDSSTLTHRNDFNSAMVLAKNRSKYTYISIGVDWGGGGESGLSRTAIAIIGWKGDAKPDVLFMQRITNPMPLDQEVAYIRDVVAKFKADILADDYCGAGSAKEIVLLQSGFPQNKLMPISYIASGAKKMMEFVPSDDTISNPYIKVPKAKSLAVMAALINKGYYSFPVFESWDSLNYPDNLLSLVQEKRDRMSSGASYIITHKANRADDLAHAINYATLAYWYVTKKTPDLSKLMDMGGIEKP